MQKKKKKTVIIVSVLGVVILVIGVFFLGRISVKDKSPEPKNNLPDNSREIQKLRKELNLVKNQLNQSNINQKKQLENKLSDIENKIKILADQDKSIIQELEKEIKEIKDKIKNDKPDNPEPIPSDKKEEKVLLHANEETKDFCLFSNWLNTNKKEDIKVFLISKNHPRIKELLGQGKLQKDKWFTIRYGKIDKKTDEGLTYSFNEFNRDLEIIET